MICEEIDEPPIDGLMRWYRSACVFCIERRPVIGAVSPYLVDKRVAMQRHALVLVEKHAVIGKGQHYLFAEKRNRLDVAVMRVALIIQLEIGTIKLVVVFQVNAGLNAEI